MVINKIESKLIKSVSVMIGMFVLQLVLFNTSLYTHLQAQIIFTGSLLVQLIASLSACFFLAWLFVVKITQKSKKECVNDVRFQDNKKKAA